MELLRIFYFFMCGATLVNVCIFLMIPYKQRMMTYPTREKVNMFQRYTLHETVQSLRNYTILWMKPPLYLLSRPDAQYCGFDACQYSNCHVTFNKSKANCSDAVIFDGRSVGPNVAFKRPHGQVWIFAAHESPAHYFNGPWTRPPWSWSFNWTMTYDASNTDIYLPYGELRKRHTLPLKNYTNIASKKTNGILMINSHCPTQSKRESFVSKLQKYIPVKILGNCGENWNCGERYVHDDSCFQILNKTFKFFLAFENSMCHQYFTEKYFDNYNYDIILVTRGGRKYEASNVFPSDTYISTDDFDSVESLAMYLRQISRSVDQYAELLKRKDQYYSVGYKSVYQRAMCDICKRMNNQSKYLKTIPNMYKKTYDKKPCREPYDVK